MTKRLITLLLAGLLILSLFPAYALATESNIEYKVGDTLEVAGTEAPTVNIPANTKWEQQGDAAQRPAQDPSCGKTPHTHGKDTGCQLQCTLQEHTHVVNCPEDCTEEHEHHVSGCGGEGICTITEHTHGDGSGCQLECSLEEHAHVDSCYPAVTYTTWKLAAIADPGNNSGNPGGNEDDGNDGKKLSKNNSIVSLPNRPNHQQFEVTYGNKTIILGLGTIMEGALHLFESGRFGDYYPIGATWPFQYQLVLGAFEIQNNGNGAITLAPADFYDCISNVKVEVVSCQNADGSQDPYCFLVNDPSVAFEPATSLIAGTFTGLGVNMPQVYAMADPGNCFDAEFKVTFDLKLPGDTEATTCTIDSLGGYWGPTILEVTAPNNAEGLNEMLSSFDKLMECMTDAQKEKLQRTSGSPGPENPLIYIRLPEANYGDVISYNIQIPSNMYIANIEIYGSDSTKTTMSGLEINGYVTHIYNIGFVYDGKADSGIHVNPNRVSGICNIESVRNCSFTSSSGSGYAYGIRNEGINFVRAVRSCTFANCDSGLYMDCAAANDAANINDGDNHHNTFRNCRYAVQVKNLPQSMRSYHFRMSNSIFENNHKDFKITTAGNKHYYYFFRNYYNGTYSAAASISDTASFRAAAIESDSNAVAVTNPCRTSPAENSPLWVFGGEGQETRIFARNAGAMLIAGEAFTDSEEKKVEKRVTIINDNEAEIATWIFGGADE